MKTLTRIWVILLIPCLIVDPATASSCSRECHSAPNLFTYQVLALHPLTNRLAESWRWSKQISHSIISRSDLSWVRWVRLAAYVTTGAALLAALNGTAVSILGVNPWPWYRHIHNVPGWTSVTAHIISSIILVTLWRMSGWYVSTSALRKSRITHTSIFTIQLSLAAVNGLVWNFIIEEIRQYVGINFIRTLISLTNGVFLATLTDWMEKRITEWRHVGTSLSHERLHNLHEKILQVTIARFALVATQHDLSQLFFASDPFLSLAIMGGIPIIFRVWYINSESATLKPIPVFILNELAVAVHFLLTHDLWKAFGFTSLALLCSSYFYIHPMMPKITSGIYSLKWMPRRLRTGV